MARLTLKRVAGQPSYDARHDENLLARTDDQVSTAFLLRVSLVLRTWKPSMLASIRRPEDTVDVPSRERRKLAR